jgi:F-type H+-transporting ATPase subunit alpha
MRAKVNDSVVTGLRVIDSTLPIGKGQRQLILGDRFTGKTSIFLSILLSTKHLNFPLLIDGFGSKRLFGIYVGINQNLSKL